LGLRDTPFLLFHAFFMTVTGSDAPQTMGMAPPIPDGQCARRLPPTKPCVRWQRTPDPGPCTPPVFFRPSTICPSFQAAQLNPFVDMACPLTSQSRCTVAPPVSFFSPRRLPAGISFCSTDTPAAFRSRLLLCDTNQKRAPFASAQLISLSKKFPPCVGDAILLFFRFDWRQRLTPISQFPPGTLLTSGFATFRPLSPLPGEPENPIMI